jgi:hypothetical protein
MSRKTKTIKKTLMRKGEVAEYQTLIEFTIGDMLAGLSCYEVNEENQRAYLHADCDYEIIIRPKK